MDKTKALSDYRLEKAKQDLETAKMNFEKHSSILGYFNKNYISNGRIDKEYYKIIASAFDIRTKSDYQDFYIVAKDDAKKQIDDVETFIKMIDDFIIFTHSIEGETK